VNRIESRILVVDDDADLALATSRLLEQSGYTAVSVRTGAEAWRSLQASRPDLILLDRDLPDQDGVDLCRRIKGDPLYADVFVILISGTFTQSADQVTGLEAGADGYILRPISNHELAARVDAFIRIRRLNRMVRASEQWHRAIMEQAGDAIILRDVGGRILEVNRRACQNLGYTREELVSMTLTDIDPQVCPSAASAMWDRLLAGESLTFESHHRRKDGTLFPVEVSLGCVRLPLGPAVLGISRDITERKKAEVALAENERSLREAQRVGRLGSFLLDIATGFWTSSEMMDEVFGIDAAYERSVAGWLALVHPADRARMDAYFRNEVLAARRAFDQEYRVVRHCDQVERWVHGRGELELDAQGQPVKMRGTIQDVTERRRAQADLERTARDWQTTFDATNDAIWVLDQNHRILRTNRTAERIFHRPCAEILGECCWTVAHGTAGPPHYCPLVRAQQTGQRETTELQQGERWFEVVVDPIRDAAGRHTGAVHIVSDITERKQAEERLRKQAALLDAANDAIYVRRLDHTIVYWNAGAQRLYGVAPREALGRKITDVAHLDAAVFETAHLHLLEHGHWSGELTKVTEAGKEIVLFCRWTLLRDEQGRPQEVLAINSDITAKKQLEAQLLRSQRVQAIGTLTGGIAHDLNNILAPLMMIAPLLRQKVSDPAGLQLVATVENCARRGADIIKQMLTFARGKPELHALLPLRPLFDDLQRFIGETFPRNIQSRVNVPAVLWPVLADPTQIHQAILNLCINARDAMPGGGLLTLAAENVALEQRSPALPAEARPGQYVRLSVADTGTGISPEILDRIYDPFFTTKEVGRGTGLGLATVHGILRGHGGFVCVSTQVGRGSTFELYLPVVTEARTDAAPAPDGPPRRGQGELILLVDDEASVRLVLQRILEEQGYRVLIAEEGFEALALLKRRGPEVQLVITDLMMPGMDGAELVSALRRSDPRLPILGMTGLTDPAAFEGTDNPPLSALLTKPFTREKLLTALGEVLVQPQKDGAASA